MDPRTRHGARALRKGTSKWVLACALRVGPCTRPQSQYRTAGLQAVQGHERQRGCPIRANTPHSPVYLMLRLHKVTLPEMGEGEGGKTKVGWALVRMKENEVWVDGGGGGDLFTKQTNANQRQCTPPQGLSASLFAMPNPVDPKTHTASETENRTSCLTALVRPSQSVAVSQTSAISIGYRTHT